MDRVSSWFVWIKCDCDKVEVLPGVYRRDMITSHHINMIRGNSLRDREVVAIDLKTRSRLFVVGGWPTLELITAAPRDRRRYSRSSVAVSHNRSHAKGGRIRAWWWLTLSGVEEARTDTWRIWKIKRYSLCKCGCLWPTTRWPIYITISDLWTHRSSLQRPLYSNGCWLRLMASDRSASRV